MSNSEVKHLEEIGKNSINIVKRLLTNQNLLRYLEYTDKDPLNTEKQDIAAKDAYKDGSNGTVRIVPVIPNKEDSKSIVVFRILKGVPTLNTDFTDIHFSIEVFVPTTQWIMKGELLRPYAIMGEVEKTLDNKIINGLGKISNNGFSVQYLTEEMSVFVINYSITQFT